MKRTLIAALGAISLSACAQQTPQSAQAPGAQASSANQTAPAAAKPTAGTPEARAVEAIRQLNPQVTVEKVAAAPLPGFREDRKSTRLKSSHAS